MNESLIRLKQTSDRWQAEIVDTLPAGFAHWDPNVGTLGPNGGTETTYGYGYTPIDALKDLLTRYRWPEYVRDYQNRSGNACL